MADVDIMYAGALRTIKDRLDKYMQGRGVSPETREQILTLIDIMAQYPPYVAKQGKDPTDPKVLRAFLIEKGKNTAALFGNDQVACGLAVYDLLQSTYTAIGSTRSGNLPIATLGWGLALLELVDMGNSCTPVQQAWYEAFYRQHTIRIRQIRLTAAPGMTMP